jgi:TetR/AcrR family transcriptional repressor of nem operon
MAWIPVDHAPRLHDSLTRHQFHISPQRYVRRKNSCPIVALPTDVARSGPRAKGAFETVFRAKVSVLERSMIDNNDARRLRAQGIAAMCIGGMIVARTIVDRALANELRASCMAVAHDLAGWKLHPNSNLKKFPRRGRKARRTARP